MYAQSFDVGNLIWALLLVWLLGLLINISCIAACHCLSRTGISESKYTPHAVFDPQFKLVNSRCEGISFLPLP